MGRLGVLIYKEGISCEGSTILLFLNEHGEEEELIAFDERFFRNKRREGRRKEGEFRDPRNDAVTSRLVFFQLGEFRKRAITLFKMARFLKHPRTFTSGHSRKSFTSFEIWMCACVRALVYSRIDLLPVITFYFNFATRVKILQRYRIFLF